ncbi:MAG: hypothetical protein E7207_09490 [Clostridium butyricum]|nr:hypothetical protein [Clostridium butyricum]
MKPYNKDFLLKEIDKYNNIIHERNSGNYKIVKNNISKEKLQGYMYKEKEKYDIDVVELLENDKCIMKLDIREIQSDYEAIKFAKGKVGVVGLGLGYIVQEIAKKSDVHEIVVYEISNEVIEMYNENFEKNDKIRIIQGDAFKAQSEKFDFFFVDIYNYKLTSKVVEDYKKFNKLHEIEEYSFWGMEHFLLSCSYEELLWVFIPENWVAMCKNLYEKFEGSGYIKYYKPLGDKKVSSILSKFKDVLNAE